MDSDPETVRRIREYYLGNNNNNTGKLRQGRFAAFPGAAAGRGRASAGAQEVGALTVVQLPSSGRLATAHSVATRQLGERGAWLVDSVTTPKAEDSPSGPLQCRTQHVAGGHLNLTCRVGRRRELNWGVEAGCCTRLPGGWKELETAFHSSAAGFLPLPAPS